MRRYLAELVGTFFVVFLAAGTVVADVFLTHVRLADSFGPLGLVAAYGAGVAVAMAIVMPVSGGHLNPAISIAAYVSKRLSIQDTLGYVVAQLAGALIAGFLLRALAPKSAFDFASGGVPGLAAGISTLRGAGLETLLTFFVTFAFWAVCIDDRGHPRAAPAVVGLSVAAAGLVGVSFTGAAVNPARWFGPAVAGTHFASWIVWVAGPLLGALLGSLTYEVIFSPAPTEEEIEAAEEELEDDEDELAPVGSGAPASSFTGGQDAEIAQGLDEPVGEGDGT
ncbi:MAG TPA: aquaporin [Actinomycetota bacterium]|nr:aquaporin [Actinomycetota bacterium]